MADRGPACALHRLPHPGDRFARRTVCIDSRRTPRVELAQPLQSFATSAATQSTAAYNDPYLGLQRGLWEMSVVAAHNWSRGAGATVAIIDTGLDTSHPDLAGRVRLTRNFVDHDRTQFEHDRHGTQVAGVIAAVGDNGQGIVGVAPQVQLLAFKACWEARPDAPSAICNSFTLALAMQAAIDAHVDVVNLSLVGPADKLLAALIEKAIEHGTIVVGAVPPSGRMDGFPAGVAGVLGVDMAEREGQANGALRAPGLEILTLTPQGHYDFATRQFARRRQRLRHRRVDALEPATQHHHDESARLACTLDARRRGLGRACTHRVDQRVHGHVGVAHGRSLPGRGFVSRACGWASGRRDGRLESLISQLSVDRPS